MMNPHTHGLVWILFLPKILLFLALDILAVIIVHKSAMHEHGELALAGGALAFVAFYITLLLRIGKALRDPDSEIGQKLVLSHEPAPAPDTWSHLEGVTGTAVTALRPSGTAEIAGKRQSVVADSGFIRAGQAVVVVESTAFRTVVRELPPDEAR